MHVKEGKSCETMKVNRWLEVCATTTEHGFLGLDQTTEEMLQTSSVNPFFMSMEMKGGLNQQHQAQRGACASFLGLGEFLPLPLG